jgi:ParB-like chromosome segregation protein Spo0J
VTANSKPSWRNRIVSHGQEDPESLLANPRNWRIHPDRQQKSLSGVLDQLGWVQEITVNQRTGFVVDGHLRVALAISKGESSVPVRYVDLDEEEEALMLATLDPIAGMAAVDQEKLDQLLIETSAQNGDVEKLLEMLASKPSIDPKELIGRNEDYKQRFELVIECGSESELEELYTQMTESGHKCRTLML